ncbi:MAG: hypothetical protein AAGI11_14950 [Pseudomonadota bacterium]
MTSAASKPRQISEQIAFFFRERGPQDFSQLEHWFSILEEGESIGDPAPYPLPDELPQSSIEWLCACMRLIRICFQAALVPAFHTPQIAKCELVDEESRNWRITFTVPHLEDLSTETVQLAFDTSNRILAWLVRTQPDDQNRTILFNTIQQLFLDPTRTKFGMSPSPHLILQKAYELGIPFRHLGRGSTLLGWGAKARMVYASSTENDSGIGLRLSTSKLLTADILRSAGLPAGEHVIVRDVAQAEAAIEKLGWPVVVKPDDGDRGEGISLDIRDEAGLTKAFQLAQSHSASKTVMVERVVSGICHRLFVLEGRLLFAIRREPTSLCGDGRSSVEELVAEAVRKERMRPPWKRMYIDPSDDMSQQSIAAAGFGQDDIVADGAMLPLRPIESTAWGGTFIDVMDSIHPENQRIALEAARLFGLSVAGVDLITPDISRPWHENGAIFNEINASPSFGMHHISEPLVLGYLLSYLGGTGRIPVEVFVGGDAAWLAAQQRWEGMLADGLAAMLTSARDTIEPWGARRYMAFNDLYRRVTALTRSRSVEAIVMVVQSDEFLHAGLPLEWIDRLEIVDQQLSSFLNPEAPLAADGFASLEHLLQWWVCPQAGEPSAQVTA